MLKEGILVVLELWAALLRKKSRSLNRARDNLLSPEADNASRSENW